MKEISILLPSLRPELCQLTINAFKATTEDVDYEIVVCSPFEVTGERITWVNEGVDPIGSVAATRQAYRKSDGEYVVYFSDDVHPTYGCLRTMLDFMKTKESPFIGAFRMLAQTGKEIGPFGAYGKLYACYGCLNHETVKKIGGFFYPAFMYSWVDIDMSLRCWQRGGKVEICKDACVVPRQIEDEVYLSHRKKYFHLDEDTFLELWHEILGRGYERSGGSVNRRLNGN